MKGATKRKPIRTEFVSDERLKQSFEHAAAYLGLGLSSFLRLAAREKIGRMKREGYKAE